MRGCTTVNTKKLAGAAAVGAVTAVTTLLIGATPALAQESSKKDDAYALSVSGLLDIDPVSAVESKDGKLVHDELLALGDVAGEYEDDLSFGLLTAEAQSQKATATVKEVNLFDILRADVVETWCDNGKGGLNIVNGTLLGKKLPNTAVPSQDIDLSPIAKVELNSQKRGTDGSLSVTGIELTVLPSASGQLDQVLSPEDKAQLPVIGKLLGKNVDTGSSTVGDVVADLGLPLAADGDLLTVTVGYAHCQEGAASGGNDKDDDGKDDGDNNGKDDADKDDDGKSDKDDDGKSNGGKDDKDSEVKSAGTAPAPSVVQAALPVTG